MIWKLIKIWKERIRFWYLENLASFGENDFKSIRSKHPPVFLVAGIYASARSLLPLKRYLEKRGFEVVLPPDKKNIEKVPILAKRLTEKILKHPAPKIQIVAHSLGGITSLYAMQNPQVNAKVAQLITLGSPLAGCFLGTLAFWEERRNRRFVKFLSRDIQKITLNPLTNAKVMALHAKLDGVVFPNACATLPHAKENGEIGVYGHAGLLMNSRSYSEVAKRLVK